MACEVNISIDDLKVLESIYFGALAVSKKERSLDQQKVIITFEKELLRLIEMDSFNRMNRDFAHIYDRKTCQENSDYVRKILNKMLKYNRQDDFETNPNCI